MRPIRRLATASFFCAAMVYAGSASAQIGKRFPSERKVVEDPVTGVDLVFLTSTPAGDSKIYQTHNQWTAVRSEEHTSELQSLMRTSYAVFRLKKKILVIYNKNTS